MERIKLTIHHLYKLPSDSTLASACEKQDTTATARIYAGDTLLLIETMQGQANHFERFIPFEHLHESCPEGQALRVEWECDGSTEMSVSRVEMCPCCGSEGLHG
ncbi:hypothetical protein ACMV8I_02215 [Ewingella sp. S1.OA.A_B6]